MKYATRNIEDVIPGDKVFANGYLFRVTAAHVVDDKYELAAEQIVRDGEKPLPGGYRHGMTIGGFAGFPVTLAR